MTHETVTTTLAGILDVAHQRRLSPMGCLPNWHEPSGHSRKGSGWGAEHVAQVEACRAFLRSPDRPSYRRAQSSYFLKHEVERQHEAAGGFVYVTNGAFMVACWLEGLRPRRVRTIPLSPNAMIVLPKRSAS